MRRPLSQAGTLLQQPGSASFALSKTGIYVPAGWGQSWKAARNSAGSAQAVVAVKGDSVACGAYSSSLASTSWVGRVTTALQAAYGDGGSGFYIGQRSSLNAVLPATYSSPADIVSYSGASWAVFNNLGGAGDGGIRCAAAPSTDHTVTFQVRGTRVQVFYLTGASLGSFSWTLDGVSQGTVSETAATGAAKTAAVTVADGTHTVVITVLTGSNAVYINGVRGYKTTGVTVDNYSISGETSTTAAVVNFGDSVAWTGGAENPCDLLIYAEGLNDANTGVAVDTYITNVATFLRKVRDGAGTSPKNGATDLVILANHVGKYDNSSTPIYYNYVARLRALAEGYGAALINMWAIYQNSYAYANAAGFWGNSASLGAAGTDNVHLSNAGHQAIANQVLPLLTAA